MESTVFLRFGEADSETRPSDAAEGLEDLVAAAPLTMPDVVESFTGLGRAFVPGDATGLVAADRESGSTLHQRDMTIQAIVRFDFQAQFDSAAPGAIYVRGKGDAIAEYSSGGIELRTIDEPTRGTEIRWLWHDAAGVLKEQTGAYFIAPSSGSMLVTATRRWISPTRVALRYFLGDEMLLEVISTDGSIGGGTTGTTQIGTRWTGAAWGNHLAGDIDELRVIDRELAVEEIAMTWQRLTDLQPKGYELVKKCHPPGFPISDDPASRVQKETRLWGHALGGAASLAEVLRRHTAPLRAYGATLEEWEHVTRPIPPRQGDSIEQRRARVVARLRESKGVSPDGVKDVLAELVETDVDNLEILSFSPTTHDTFETLNEERWVYDPPATWMIAANALRVPSGASMIFDGGLRGWYTARTSIGADGRAAQAIAKIIPTTLAIAGATSSEVGIFFADFVRGNIILAGLRHHGASNEFRIVSESFKGWVPEGVVVHGTLPGLAPLWLHVALENFAYNPAQRAPDTDYTVAWSTVAEAGPYTSSATSTLTNTGYQWCGLYARTADGAGTPAIDVSFDNVKVRAPYGDRAMHFYVYRDPSLPGQLDAEAANAILRDLKHDYTEAAVVTAKAALYDDDNTTYDSAPMGGI